MYVTQYIYIYIYLICKDEYVFSDSYVYSSSLINYANGKDCRVSITRARR